MKKRLIALVLAGAMAASLAACGGTSSSTASTDTKASTESAAETTDAGDAGADSADAEEIVIPVHEANYEGTAHSATKKHELLNVAISVEPGDLSPEQSADGTGNMWRWNVYEHLFEINGFGGDLVGATAEKYEQIDDTTYRIYLYQGVTDSDGNELHSSDVKYAYDTLKAAGNRMSGDIAKYETIEVIDDYTFDMIMNEPLTGLSDLSAILGQCYVYTEKAAQDHNLAVDPCGTGPYKVTDYQSGSSITMEARDDYWAEGTDHQTIRQCANVQTLVYKVVAEPAQNATGLQTGAIDFSTGVSATDISKFDEGGEYADSFHTVQYLSNLSVALFANCDADHDDLNLRLAIFYALDGEQLADASGLNAYLVAHTLANAKYPEFQDEWYTQDNYYNVQDLDKAAEYLAASNYDGRALTLLVQNSATNENMAVAIQAMLMQIGITVDINSVDGTIVDSEQQAGNYDLEITQMASDNYMPIIWQRWFDTDFHGDRPIINNASDDKLQEMVSALNTVEGDTPEAISEFHQYLIDNAYGYALFSECTSDVITNDIVTECWNFQDFLVPGGCIYADNEF